MLKLPYSLKIWMDFTKLTYRSSHFSSFSFSCIFNWFDSSKYFSSFYLRSFINSVSSFESCLNELLFQLMKLLLLWDRSVWPRALYDLQSKCTVFCLKLVLIIYSSARLIQQLTNFPYSCWPLCFINYLVFIFIALLFILKTYRCTSGTLNIVKFLWNFGHVLVWLRLHHVGLIITNYLSGIVTLLQLGIISSLAPHKNLTSVGKSVFGQAFVVFPPAATAKTLLRPSLMHFRSQMSLAWLPLRGPLPKKLQ